MNEQDETRLDNFLRDKLGGYRPVPSEQVWSAIEKRLSTPADKPSNGLGRWFPVLLVGVMGLLVGGLLSPIFQRASQLERSQAARPVAGRTMSRLQAGAPSAAESTTSTPAEVVVAAPVVTPAAFADGAAVAMLEHQRRSAGLSPTSRHSLLAPPVAPAPPSGPSAAAPSTSTSTGAGTPAPASPPVAGVDALPATPPQQLPPPAVTVLVQIEHTVHGHLGDTTRAARANLYRALELEKLELTHLQHRADSLLLTLQPEAAVAASAQPDSSTPKPMTHRWSVALAFAPEHTFLGLQAPVADTLVSLRRNHEAGRASFNASIMGEYRVNNRLSVGLGVGYSTYGAELRLTDRRTQVDVRYDTTTTYSTSTFTSTNTVYAVHEDTILQFTPRFNATGQVIAYDTIFIPRRDTTFTTVVQNDTVHITNKTISPVVSRHEVTTYKALRPDYHFVTLPVLVRYRLTPNVKGARWWTDIALGAQFQLFRGGSQLVTTDGRTYHTERVGPREGPFRPLNIALTGQLALNYGLTPRLSVSLAPAVRWQIQSVYKKETGLRQQPTATGVQIGARWVF